MPPQQYSLAFRVANIVLGCFQNITAGGVLYGWASISGSMLLASPTDGGAGLTHDYIHIMFVTASFFNFLGPLLLGAILDSYGPRVCSVISMFFISLGCILFAVSNVPNFPMFIPALSMVAFGGPGVQSAIVHLCNLFPGNKGTATAVITGSFQLSFIIFLIFDQLWHFYKYDYQMLFMGYAVVCLGNMLLSLLLWPDEPYTYEEPLAVPVSISIDQSH
jgi:MFS family permease